MLEYARDWRIWLACVAVITIMIISDVAWAGDITINRPDGTKIVYAKTGEGNGVGYRMVVSNIKFKFSVNKVRAVRDFTPNCSVRAQAKMEGTSDYNSQLLFTFTW
jgi:hypothetical protein